MTVSSQKPKERLRAWLICLNPGVCFLVHCFVCFTLPPNPTGETPQQSHRIWSLVTPMADPMADPCDVHCTTLVSRSDLYQLEPVGAMLHLCDAQYVLYTTNSETSLDPGS